MGHRDPRVRQVQWDLQVYQVCQVNQASQDYEEKRVRKERREWVSQVKMEKMVQKDPRDLLVHQDLQDNLSALSIQGQGAEK